MIKNYFLIAIRNLSKNRIFTAINIAGLAIGIATFVFILEYVSLETSMNQFHTNLPQLYRVLTENKEGEAYPYHVAGLPVAMKEQLAEVKDYCRLMQGSMQGVVTYSGEDSAQSFKTFREEKIILAEGNFFELFSFPIVEGEKSLAKSNSVAISESHAKKYFGKEKALGKILTLHNQFGKQLYTVTAVFEDVKQNSDLQFEMVFSLETLKNPANLNGNDWASLDGWDANFLGSYVLLQKDVNIKQLEEKIAALYRKKKAEMDWKTVLQSAKHIHLAENLGDTYLTYGSLKVVYLLLGIATLIILIAWFNYINLSTAGSMKRMKEVAVRKVIGATRSQLISQFLLESTLLNLLGLGLAIVLVSLLQTPFNGLINKELDISVFLQNNTGLLGLLFVFVGAMGVGVYVAFMLSYFPPTEALKGTFTKSSKGVSLRKVLVVSQFTISMILLIATFVLYKQLQFMQNKDLGMKTEQLLAVKGAEITVTREVNLSNSSAFVQKIAQLPFVQGYCQTGNVPSKQYNFNAVGFTKQNPKPDDEKKGYNMFMIDERFIDTYQIQLLAGQNFTLEMCEKGWGSNKIMMNEKAISQIGFKTVQEAIGQKIKWGENEYEIMGVVKDYNHQSTKEVIEPIIFLPSQNSAYFTIRLNTKEIQNQLAQIESTYKEIFAGNPFQYFFLDEEYNRQYETERQYSQIFMIAACLAILIACLGLLGLTTFTVEARTKEIGIRKVLGASVASIVTLLSKDFVKLVSIAFVIAVPIAWYAADTWLADFAYKTEISWWIFALAGVLAASVAIITVSWQSIKAALANPVTSLRSE